MAKKLDLSKSVYELVEEYPELREVLAGLGFSEITKDAMLYSVGKLTTIPKGAKMKGIEMMDVVMTLMQSGYELIGKMPEGAMEGASSKAVKPEIVQNQEDTITKLKGYLRRLGNGEDLESVRVDFAANFKEIDAAEIMKAEQELMKEGIPLAEVQKLCDVHSALFHGATKAEQIANAERAVEESLRRSEEEKKEEIEKMHQMHDEKMIRAKKLEETPGHPLHTATLINQELEKRIAEFHKSAEQGTDLGDVLHEIRQIAVHYAKKGDLFYPVLKVNYEISGPSDVMWTVDDEIRDELAALDKDSNHDEKWLERARTVVKRAEEMIYKENNILFPILAMNFTEEEWYGIYQDGKDYALVFGVEEKWEEAESFFVKKAKEKESALMKGEVVMPGGHMSVEQLTAMLNCLPFEVTFVDEDNINRYFNEGPKVFKRPQMAIDREVFSCHPPKVEAIVRNILDDFRAGKRDKVEVWMEKVGKIFLVSYIAVRDKSGKYLGTMEVVQDMEEIKQHFLN